MDVSVFLNGEPEGKWYPIPGSNVKLKIRQLKPKESDELRRACMKRKFVNRQMTQEVDVDLLNAALLDRMVMDWKGVEKDGQPFPCTSENKTLLDQNWAAFRELWNSVAVAAEQVAEEAQESEKKKLTEWGRFYFSRQHRGQIEHCNQCQNGEEIQCLRDSESDGLCPVADLAPKLLPLNHTVVMIYNQASGSGQVQESDRRALLFLRPSDVESLMRIHGVSADDWREVFERVLIVQDLKNEYTPKAPRPTGGKYR